jgi:hypothetical protein
MAGLGWGWVGVGWKELTTGSRWVRGGWGDGGREQGGLSTASRWVG